MPVGRTRRSSVQRLPADKKLKPMHEGLRALVRAYEKAEARPGPMKKSKLEREGGDIWTGPKGERALELYFDRDDGDKAGISWLPFTRVMVDPEKKQFWAKKSGDDVGPIDLPRGVKLEDLLDDGRSIPRGSTKAEKATSALARAVKKQRAEVYMNGNTKLDYDGDDWRSPTGEKMHHYYLEGYAERGIPGGAVMVGKEEFWVEQIPGYSGNCLGPFELPRNFDHKDLKPRRRSTSSSSSSSSSSSRRRDSDSFDSGRRSSYGGGGSGNYGSRRWVHTGSGSWSVPSGGSGS